MSARKRGDSKLLPVTSAAEVRHLTGPVTDRTMTAILNGAIVRGPGGRGSIRPR
jgi:hypothetical protein